MGKSNRISTIDDHAECGVFLSIEQGLYMLYLSRIRRTALSKHVIFNENLVLIAKAINEMVYERDDIT